MRSCKGAVMERTRAESIQWGGQVAGEGRSEKLQDRKEISRWRTAGTVFPVGWPAAWRSLGLPSPQKLSEAGAGLTWCVEDWRGSSCRA